MCKRLELNFDDWLEMYEVKQDNNPYKMSLKKLNEKIEADKLLLRNKQTGIKKKDKNELIIDKG